MTRRPGDRLRSGLLRGSAWLLALLAPAPCGCGAPPGIPPPPESRREAVTDTIHGVDIVDHYRWLEDQESPGTRAWIDAQNSYTRSLLEGRPERDAILKRVSELLRVDRTWSPTVRGDRLFYWKRGAGDDLAIFHMSNPDGSGETVLLDPRTLSEDGTTGISVLDITTDGSLVAYGIRQGGEDEVEIHFLDPREKNDLPDVLPRGLYSSVEVMPDRSGLFYGRSDRVHGLRIYHHRIGTSPEEDRIVFGEGIDPDNWLSATLSDDGRYLLFSVHHGWASTDLHLQSPAGTGRVIPLVEGIPSRFSAGFAGETLVIQTNWEAPNKRIMAADLARPGIESWREIVPEGPHPIQGYSLAGGRIFVHYLENVTSRIRAYSPEGEEIGGIELPGPGSASPPEGSWEGTTAFYDYVSFTAPRTSFRYDIGSGKSEEWARDRVPVDPGAFVVNQVWYSSKDGTRVPMFLVHRKDIRPDGKRPVLLYGYGGFNVSLTPSFSTTAVWWAEQGGVYALANIRGGGEFGEAWHRAGMLENKQNVFDDFIAAAEWLIAEGYTNPDKLAIQGGSNGGLLVGAALTQRPDLYRAVLCQFPDLDMVRYYQFENNNPPALKEYGDASDPEQFKFLHAYSPYQKVRQGVSYPAVLLSTGDADTRVPPLQARKMTAVLQWAGAPGRPVLLRYDTKAGHAGGRPMSKYAEDLSMDLSFLHWQLGMGEP